MYALIGTLPALPGKRGELIAILERAAALTAEMSGCRMYLVLEDAADDSLVVVFEIWDDRESHDESLKDPRVGELIAQAMPLLGGAPAGRELRVAGGLKPA